MSGDQVAGASGRRSEAAEGGAGRSPGVEVGACGRSSREGVSCGDESGRSCDAEVEAYEMKSAEEEGVSGWSLNGVAGASTRSRSGNARSYGAAVTACGRS